VAGAGPIGRGVFWYNQGSFSAGWLAEMGTQPAEKPGGLVPDNSGPFSQPTRPTPKIIQVDPAQLRVPPGRPQGADPGKLARQIAKHGRSLDGMPPLQVIRGKDGHLRINDGVTRATRVAKLDPGQTVPAEVIQDLPSLDVTRMPTIKDVLP